MHRPRPAAAALLSAFVLIAGTAQAAKPSRPPAPAATIPAFGAGALKAEWLAGYNGAEGLDPHGLADLETMSANGMGLYRARFRQDRVVVNGVASEWTQLDNLVRQAALRGVTILPVLINMPGEAYTPPKTDAARSAFGDFAAAAARRYGSAGSFWGTCGCPARPIRAWEVWNEPNMSVFWQAPDPAQYAQLLALTRTKLRRTDAAARIVFGGLATPATPTADKLAASPFLRAAIAAAGRDSFDALSVHSYYASAYPAPDYGVDKALSPVVDELRADAGLGSGGAPRQQLWVTEFGRFTHPASTPEQQSTYETAQAQYYDGFLSTLLGHRADWNLGPVLPYAFRDAADPTVTMWGLRPGAPPRVPRRSRPARPGGGPAAHDPRRPRGGAEPRGGRLPEPQPRCARRAPAGPALSSDAHASYGRGRTAKIRSIATGASQPGEGRSFQEPRMAALSPACGLHGHASSPGEMEALSCASSPCSRRSSLSLRSFRRRSPAAPTSSPTRRPLRSAVRAWSATSRRQASRPARSRRSRVARPRRSRMSASTAAARTRRLRTRRHSRH